jgi:hypothetical protein
MKMLTRCSFCTKSEDEVRKLFAGPTVWICNECIDLCNDIIAEEAEDAEDAEDAMGERGHRCSFCGKHADEVGKLIAGPTVYICNECIDRCNQMVFEEAVDTAAGEHEVDAAAAPSPQPSAEPPVAADCRHCWHTRFTEPAPQHGPYAPRDGIVLHPPPRAMEAVCCLCATAVPYDSRSEPQLPRRG